jgi:hypothetical protein
MWKKLIELGLFDESYAQRINASFQFLCPDSNSNSFSLKDLIHRGGSILTYLNLDVEKDSNFAVMDLFRLFDRSGKGNVFVEDFVLGVIEKVNTLHEDSDALQSIAEHILQVESRCIELATLLEKGSLSNEHFVKFNVHLKAHSHIIRHFIRAMKTQHHHLSALDKDSLVHIFRMSLAHAVRDVQQYFRLSNSRLAKLVTKPTYNFDFPGQVHVGGSSSGNGRSSRSLWALVTPVHTSGGGGGSGSGGGSGNNVVYVLNADVAHSDVGSHDPASMPLLDKHLAQGTNNGNSSAPTHGVNGSSVANSATNNAAANLSYFAQQQNNAMSLNHLHNAAHVSEEALGQLLLDMQQSQLLPLNFHSALHRTVSEDSSQLHVLQDALLALNNLFTLRCVNDSRLGPFAEHDVLALSPSDSFVPIQPPNPALSKSAPLHSPVSRMQFHSHHTNNNAMAEESNYETQLQQELVKKVEHFREFLHNASHPTSTGSATTTSASNNNTGTTTTSKKQGSTFGAETVLENALLSQLLQTQEELLRCQKRMSVLELLQTQVVSEHALNSLLEPSDYNPNQPQQPGGNASSSNRGSPSAEEMMKKFQPFFSAGQDNNNNSSSNKRRKALLSAAQTVNSLSFFNSNNQNNSNQNTNNNGTNVVTDAFGVLTTSQDDTSFDQILQELHLLGASLAERASTAHSLGLLLDGGSSVAVIDVRAHKLPPSIFLGTNNTNPVTVNSSNTALANPGGNSSNNNNSSNTGSASNKISNPKEKQDDKAKDPSSSAAVQPTPSAIDMEDALLALLQNLDTFAKELHEELKRRVESSVLRDAQQMEQRQAEQRLCEQQLSAEQADFERNEFLALSVEMQVLREKAQKIARDDVQMKLMEQRNSELVKRIRDLEEQVSQQSNSSGSNALMKAHKSNSSLLVSNSNFNNQQQQQAMMDLQKARESVSDLQRKLEEKSNEWEQVIKENQRLKSANKVSEQRVKSALQDQMALHSQIQQLEEDNMSCRTTITKLTRELEEQRGLRSFKEDAERRIFDLQKELSKRDVEFAEAKETASLANKYHNDLIATERSIETLEQRLAEYSVELEKGTVAINQLENYREQLRGKTKEIRDLSLHIHALESQLKDVGYLQHRVNELSEELQDTKIKGEKIPGLLAEIARLRGGTRASIKALAEQDKLLAQLKQRVKVLEKENALLRNDNKALQDVEIKLKDSHAEVKRLLTLVSEVQATKQHSVRNAEEEKKSMEHQYKKMRKFMNQSVMINHTHSTDQGGEMAAGEDPAISATNT